jgi:prophage regulatory protein
MPRKITPLKTPVASSIAAQKATIHQSVFDALPDSAFIRESQLVQSPKRPGIPAPLPFSAPTLWRMVKAGTFCKPHKLSERVTAWKVGEVRAWMAAKAMVQGLAVTNTAPKEKAASGLLTTKQPDGCNAPAHADDANGLNLPTKKRRSQAFVMPAARAVPAGCALVRADAHDAQAPSVSEPCGQPHHLHPLDEASDLLE